MRQRLKLIVFAALSAALTVAGLSIAAGGSTSKSGSSGSTSGGDPKVHRGFGPPPGMGIDADVAGVLRQIHEAVEQKGPEIAEPVIKKAEDAGDITSDQADKLRALVKAEADHKRPSGDPRTLLGDSDVRAVLQDIFQARAKQAPDIAEPIIQKALDEKKITSAQASDIRNRLKNPPPFRRGPGHGPGGPPGFGPGHGPGGPPGFGPGHGPGGPGGPPGFGKFDRDVANVFGDIHQAVEKKAPEIAEPVIKKAEDSGDITSGQADKLRAAAKAIADGKRPGAARSLLNDADVRKVVQDAFAAAGKQAPGIAEPIIQKAVDDKKITSAQAADIRAKLKNMPDFHGGPPPFGRPDRRHFGGPGTYERPGNAPGALPGGLPKGSAPGQPAPAVAQGQPA